MSPRWLAFQLALATGVLWAQPSATPEVRGVVYEQGPNTGLAGAEVVLTEFVPRGDDLDPKIFATVFTDATGAYSFKPSHLGDFRLEVRKAGYINRDAPGENARGTYLVLTAQQPLQSFVFFLMRPGSLTGRVVDEDGKPVANFPVAINQSLNLGPPVRATTDTDGIFTTELSPGNFLVHVGPKSGGLESVIDFTEDAAKIIDQDYESSYWPGESPDARSALPMTAPPGARVDIGTIILRKTNYYRVHVSISGDCAPGEKWSYEVVNFAEPDPSSTFDSIPCAQELLLRNFRRGSKTLLISGKNGDATRWASTPIDIRNENVHVDLTPEPGIDVVGRLIVPDGTVPPAFAGIRVTLQPDPATLRGANTVVSVDGGGNFLAPSRPWSRNKVGVVSLPSGYYIKEIRYNRAPVPNGILTLAAGALLEIVLDDHPAAITGTVVRVDKPVPRAVVFLAKWPLPPPVAGATPFSLIVPTNDAGLFTMSGLAPGEYRIIAMPSVPIGQFTSTADLASLIPRGEKITLERGSQQTILLKVIDPSR